VKATAWRTRARGGDGALVPSCRAPQGRDRIKEKFHFLFFFELRVSFFRPTTTKRRKFRFGRPAAAAG